eukprot:1157818-Pelagomonas_calceolata.AAC.4
MLYHFNSPAYCRYKVVSCSMDRTVQLHELPPDALNVPYGTGAHLSDEATTVAGAGKLQSP